VRDACVIGGGSPWFHDDAAPRAQIPEVVALDAGGAAVAPTVRTNINGEFLMSTCRAPTCACARRSKGRRPR